MQTYFALIGDIVGSRQLDDRAGVQRRLGAELDALNQLDAGEAMAAPLRLTAGDEVQALLVRPDAVVTILTRLDDALHPATMIWGLGRGTLSTDLQADVATLDGSCFHRARSALSGARREEAWLRAEGFGAPHDEVLSALFRLMGTIRSRWTDVQARYVREVRGRLQREVAERLGVSEPAVSKSLAAARFATIEEAECAAAALLAWLGGADAPEREAS